jgi:SRSO17 transposase
LIKISQIPPELEDFLESFKHMLSKPQYKHFTRYLMGLIAARKKNVEGISSHLAQASNRSNLTRFLIESAWDAEAAFLLAQAKTCRRIDFKFGEIVYLIIDDTGTEKTGRHIQGTGVFKNHNGDHPFYFGHNLVKAIMVYKGISLPVGIRVYCKPEFCREQGIPFKTKNRLAAELINDFSPPRGMKVVVLFDSWFLCPTVTAAIRAKRWRYVSQLKCNRLIYLGDRKYNVSEFARLVRGNFSFSNYRSRGKDQPVSVYQRVVRLNKLGRVNLVLSRDDKHNLKYLVTDFVSTPAVLVIKRYDLRWSIECYFRDVKQHLGLGEYQMRSLHGIVRHLYIVMIAYTLLVYVKLFLNRALKTIGDVCRFIISLTMRDLIGWIISQCKTKSGLLSVQTKLGFA